MGAGERRWIASSVLPPLVAPVARRALPPPRRTIWEGFIPGVAPPRCIVLNREGNDVVVVVATNILPNLGDTGQYPSGLSINSILDASALGGQNPPICNGSAEPLVERRRHARPPHARPALHVPAIRVSTTVPNLPSLFLCNASRHRLTGRQSLAARGGRPGTGVACSLVTQQPTESHQPGEGRQWGRHHRWGQSQDWGFPI